MEVEAHLCFILPHTYTSKHMYKCTFKCGHMCVQLCHASKCAHAYGGSKLPRGVFLDQSALFIDQILARQLAMVDLLCSPLECCHSTEDTILSEFWWVLGIRTLVLTLVPSLQLLHVYG